MADARITQFGVEILSQPAPDSRVSQFGVELLSNPPNVARISQFGIEILSANVAPVVSAEKSYAYLE